MLLIVLGAIGVGAYFLFAGDGDDTQGEPPAGQIQAAGSSSDAADAGTSGAAASTADDATRPSYDYRQRPGMTPQLAAGIGPSPITIKPISDADANAAFRQGMAAYRSGRNQLQARTLLNRAYTYGRLPADKASQARAALAKLANATILRADPYVNPKDPYLVSYTFQPGDTLLSKRRNGQIVRPGVIAKLDLNCPQDILIMANGLRKGTEYKADRAYKMIKGPFHLVVDLSEFAADLYVQDLFLRRMPVCIGAPETPTPTGYFRIPVGGKNVNSSYNPPAESGLANRTILPGEPDYPLGPRGLNIKLEGIRPLGTAITVSQSYAIHGTNEPRSVGTAASRGCVRLRANDMHLVYATLMNYADPENPRVNWNRYSTVTIKK
jgi:hypothetical protein